MDGKLGKKRQYLMNGNLIDIKIFDYLKINPLVL